GHVLLVDDVVGDHDLLDPLLGGDLVHDLEHRLLDDRPEPTCAALALDRFLGDGLERRFGELEANVVHLEQLLILLDQAVSRLGEDVDERFLVQLVEGGDDREAADELGDEPELEQIFGLHLAEDVAEAQLGAALHVGAEADRTLPDAALDDLIEAHEGATADEQDVRRVDLQEVLLRVLAAALRGNVGHGSLDDLEERLLHALTRDVAGDRGVIA